MGGIAKPQLRGLFLTHTTRHFAGATVFALVGALVYHYTYLEPKQRRYYEFTKNYDDKKQLKAMNEAGLMQSYQPGTSK